MLIREVAELNDGPDTKKLAALSQFLIGRSKDESAKKQISQQAFIDAAKSLGVNVNQANLGDLISKEPLSNILEPLDPASGVISFKGDTEATTGMSVDQARAVVDSNAKAALKRRQ
jgi:hypothetical protein